MSTFRPNPLIKDSYKTKCQPLEPNPLIKDSYKTKCQPLDLTLWSKILIKLNVNL